MPIFPCPTTDGLRTSRLSNTQFYLLGGISFTFYTFQSHPPHVTPLHSRSPVSTSTIRATLLTFSTLQQHHKLFTTSALGSHLHKECFSSALLPRVRVHIPAQAIFQIFIHSVQLLRPSLSEQHRCRVHRINPPGPSHRPPHNSLRSLIHSHISIKATLHLRLIRHFPTYKVNFVSIRFFIHLIHSP